MALRVAGHVASFGGHAVKSASLPTTFSLAALACHSESSFFLGFW